MRRRPHGCARAVSRPRRRRRRAAPTTAWLACRPRHRSIELFSLNSTQKLTLSRETKSSKASLARLPRRRSACQCRKRAPRPKCRSRRSLPRRSSTTDRRRAWRTRSSPGWHRSVRGPARAAALLSEQAREPRRWLTSTFTSRVRPPRRSPVPCLRRELAASSSVHAAT